MMRRYLLLLLPFLLLACSRDETQQPAQNTVPVQDESAPANVLAIVNGSPITVEELDYARSRLKTPPTNEEQENTLRKTLLESLVNSRLMAQLAEKSLSEKGIASLEMKTRGYREEMLVKNYLGLNVQPKPVTGEAVRDYYEKHPEEFGAVKEKAFEVIRSIRDIEPEARKEILEQLDTARQESDWKEWLSKHTDLPLGYKQFRVKTDLLEEPLKSRISEASKGEIRLIDNGKQIQLVRILDERMRPPKAFNQVSAEIRKKLAPIAFKEQMREHIEELKKQATITYPESRPTE